jgi:hypothetical protein
MLSYVAAVATAVTLIISPMLSYPKDGSGVKEAAKWAKPMAARTIEMPRSIEISGVAPLYYMSVAEQRVLRKALLRSVKIVSPGRRIV